jgi:hypothetical protein
MMSATAARTRDPPQRQYAPIFRSPRNLQPHASASEGRRILMKQKLNAECEADYRRMTAERENEERGEHRLFELADAVAAFLSPSAYPPNQSEALGSCDWCGK